MLWDLAILIRQGGGEQVAEIVRGRYGDDALQIADALRQIQAQVWTVLHEARASHGW